MDSPYDLFRVRLRDDSETTVYVVRHPRATTRVRVVCFPEPRRLDHWCVANGEPEAVVGGFFLRDPFRPLGEVRVDGAPITHEPVLEPWGPRRACVHMDGELKLAPRDQVEGEPAGDLLMAGPMLLAGGTSVVGEDDLEGFSAGAAQFDSDITAERHPRCALGMNDEELFVVCCDGRRSGVDAGLMLGELARVLIALGADDAINLDGGGSATLVHRGHLLNRPYSERDQPAPESRPVVTALLFGAK